MNKMLLISICSLTVSVPSGFLIYYLSRSSEPTPTRQHALSELSVSENGNQYLIGKITSDIDNNVATLPNPLKFTCEISSNKECYVKVLDRTELIKKNKSDFENMTDWFVAATIDLLKKDAYVQINFKSADGKKNTTKTETITIKDTTTTFTVELEDKKGESIQSNQKEFVTPTTTKTQDVNNDRYCLIKWPEITVNEQMAWLLPRNKENAKEFEWRISGADDSVKPKNKVEIYEIEDQNAVKGKSESLNKSYFDTQNKFIQTIDALKAQNKKWVKMVIEDTNISCEIKTLDVRNQTNIVFDYYDAVLEHRELKGEVKK